MSSSLILSYICAQKVRVYLPHAFCSACDARFEDDDPRLLARFLKTSLSSPPNNLAIRVLCFYDLIDPHRPFIL